VDGPGTANGPRSTPRVIAAGAVVFTFWLVISASVAPTDLVLGLALSLLLGWWSVRFLWSGDAPWLTLREATALLRQSPGFGLRVFLSALHVARLVLDPRLPIRPRLVTCRTDLRRDISRVAFAQAVTLTPGTLTVDMRGGEFLLHCLDEASAEHILDGSLERQVAGIFEPESLQ
jgi:multicomponent Na+:H+ antiporter subunit E